MSQESSSQVPAAHTAEEHGYVPSLPSLPAGYTAQPVWGFCDKTGLLLYEFHRVYRPSGRLLDRRSNNVLELDEDLSFWAVTWGRLQESGDELPVSRWRSYGLTRRLQNAPLSFEQFSQMREELPALFQ